ncbi:hypothetical protein NP493_3113g00000 [Ridgeia piscesae]|uniref:C2H2-type domain-containing protein n=1 Tax=Ridgeia piscesae TaxID=27915 RepID=A0AAD9J9E2_RIDPI|nr:hypothetical protein NP493_3113g00000 [Ridgeia piscesae]
MQCNVVDTSVLPRSDKNLCEWKQVTCGSIFNMAVNVKTWTIVKRFKCGTCGTYCLRNVVLLQHDRIHTVEKPCKCDTCHAQLSQSGNLKKHVRIHTGEKPYKCDTCGAQFSVNNSLKKHIRMHTGEKPYKCDTCDAQFSQRGFWFSPGIKGPKFPFKFHLF